MTERKSNFTYYTMCPKIFGKNSFYRDLHANGKGGVEFYTKKKMRAASDCGFFAVVYGQALMVDVGLRIRN
ncbi:hypothetical protein [Paenibacillus sp. Soil787]|uniref:hypothetical protein n=1 Tax=Paenibacillus sp. Soil787 TaxID=1736411 RepID=UPI0006FBBE54|nr:hypothetical protein [Paenibacillus sp. Soil787]KRF31813.1 hypothetical protein ASG93_05665 [Paenibacillus sp. Soil787]